MVVTNLPHHLASSELEPGNDLTRLAHDLGVAQNKGTLAALHLATQEVAAMTRANTLGSSVLSAFDYRHRLMGSLMQRETSTHYKYFLGATRWDEVMLWLHVFKSDQQRAGVISYSESVHHQRYGMFVRLLNGGYTNEIYDVQTQAGVLREGEPVTAMNLISRQVLGMGDSYAMTTDQFHRVHDLMPDTTTLVIQTPKEHTVSHSIDEATMTLRSHPEMDYTQFKGAVALATKS